MIRSLPQFGAWHETDRRGEAHLVAFPSYLLTGRKANWCKTPPQRALPWAQDGKKSAITASVRKQNCDERLKKAAAPSDVPGVCDVRSTSRVAIARANCSHAHPRDSDA